MSNTLQAVRLERFLPAGLRFLPAGRDEGRKQPWVGNFDHSVAQPDFTFLIPNPVRLLLTQAGEDLLLRFSPGRRWDMSLHGFEAAQHKHLENPWL